METILVRTASSVGESCLHLQLTSAYRRDVFADELLIISANTSARAALLKMYKASGDCNNAVYTWYKPWENHADGFIGGSGDNNRWKLHPTDIILVGDFASNLAVEPNQKDELLIAYPYIGNNARERNQPGMGGRSNAVMLGVINQGQPYPIEWWIKWTTDNVLFPEPHFIGSWPVRFGDRYLALDVGNSNGYQMFFALNQLRSIFSGIISNPAISYSNPQVIINNFTLDNPLESQWEIIWSNNTRSPIHVTGFGSWLFGTGGDDAYTVADIDGDGVDEIISYNPEFLHVQNFDLSTGKWSLKYSDSNDMIGVYPMTTGDRLYAGDVLYGDNKDEIIAVNPRNKGPVVIQRYDPSGPGGWELIYGNNDGYLGYWKMYER